MKRVILLLLLTLSMATVINAQDNNPVVRRLSNAEISELESPSAIAYTFVYWILMQNWENMQYFMTPEARIGFSQLSALEKQQYFSEPGKLNILGWYPALIGQYEVVVGYVRDDWYWEEDGSLYSSSDMIVENGMIYLPEFNTYHVGINHKVVYVMCCPTNEVNYSRFQDITRYGESNVKVVLEQVNGQWRVNGFK